MKIIILCFFILSLLAADVHAQIVAVRKVVPAACKDTVIDKTSWACTVGEAVIQTFSLGNYTFTEGFNQPDGYSIIPRLPYIQDLVIYPNPAHSNATLRFYLKADKPQLIIEIYDAEGRLYQNQTLQSFAGQTWHSLNPQVMASGTYMIRVTAGYDVYAGKVVIIN